MILLAFCKALRHGCDLKPGYLDVWQNPGNSYIDLLLVVLGFVPFFLISVADNICIIYIAMWCSMEFLTALGCPESWI